MALNWTKLSKPLTFNRSSHDHDTRNDLGDHSGEFSRSRMSHYWPINSMQVLQKFSTTKNLHCGTCTTDLSRKNHTKPDWSGWSKKFSWFCESKLYSVSRNEKTHSTDENNTVCTPTVLSLQIRVCRMSKCMRLIITCINCNVCWVRPIPASKRFHL